MNYVHQYDELDSTCDVGWWDRGKEGELIFRVLRVCDTDIEAAAFINYLNGGAGKPFEWD